MTQLDLSIVIVTYNGRDIALRALALYEEAIAADADHSYELIVVDNASRDGLADAVAAAYPAVNLIRNAENLGFARAGNIGYQVSSGRYLLFSNPDIEVTTETLPTLIEAMDADPGVGACTPYLELARTGEVDWGAHRGFPTPWAALTYFTRLDRLFRRSRTLSQIFGQYHLLDRDLSVPHQVDAIRGGFAFVRREAFERAGGWDEDYFMYAEDIDLCYMLRQRGYRVMFYPQARAVHYHGMTTGLKRHSEEVAVFDAHERARTYAAFYDTMKIFYDKHYRHRYSPLVRCLVFLAIDARKHLGAHRGTV
ncbi:MAG: glycosyltransferase family 2 protein [Anaerolineae bacterium]|nr:glycosyltransferase family 2 protein [Anaerolineae bacterium]